MRTIACSDDRARRRRAERAAGRRRFLGCLLALLLCTSARPSWADPALLLPVPGVRRHNTYSCGVAALLSVLAYYGLDARQDTLSRRLRTTADYGTHDRDIVRVAKGYGLQPEAAFGMTTADLIARLMQGVPVILAIQAWSEKGDPRDAKAWSSRFDDGHYVVAIGYDDSRIYFDDPAMFPIGYISFQELDARWHDREGRQVLEHFGIAISGGSHTPVSRSAYAPID